MVARMPGTYEIVRTLLSSVLQPTTVVAAEPEEARAQVSYPTNFAEARARLIKAAQASASKKTTAVRHKCFISYRATDVNYVTQFVEKFDEVFIPKVIGVSDADPFVNSTDTDYIMDQIREKYLADSTVTIVLVGKCTWSRKYVDWEVSSTLRNDQNNLRSGLLAIELPNRGSASLPARVDDNVIRDANGLDTGYARWYVYPSSASVLRSWIEDAYKAPSTRASLINDTRARRQNNSACS
jgi:hypothetical protein